LAKTHLAALRLEQADDICFSTFNVLLIGGVKGTLAISPLRFGPKRVASLRPSRPGGLLEKLSFFLRLL
jgi:hypothetical protein